MKLSILIPTTPDRATYLKRITNILNPQIARFPGEVELKILDSGKNVPTGKKRNELIAATDSEYFCFVDDDDTVPIYYVSELMKAIEQKPDVITFIGYMTTDGKKRQDFTIKLGSDYVTKDNHHYRFPNHLCCFKRSAVEHIKFPELYQREDYLWASEINDKKLLKIEVHLPIQMYHYDFISNKKRHARLSARIR